MKDPALTDSLETLIADLKYRARYWRQDGIGEFKTGSATGDFALELDRAVAALAQRVAPSDDRTALQKAEKALAFALEVVSSYEEGGEASESGEFIKTDLAEVRALLAEATPAAPPAAPPVAAAQPVARQKRAALTALDARLETP